MRILSTTLLVTLVPKFAFADLVREPESTQVPGGIMRAIIEDPILPIGVLIGISLLIWLRKKK